HRRTRDHVSSVGIAPLSSDRTAAAQNIPAARGYKPVAPASKPVHWRSERRDMHEYNLNILFVVAVLCHLAPAADQPQWGQRYSRNQTSEETNLPDTFDPEKGVNVKWVAAMGDQSYCSPIIADGRV